MNIIFPWYRNKIFTHAYAKDKVQTEDLFSNDFFLDKFGAIIILPTTWPTKNQPNYINSIR